MAKKTKNDCLIFKFYFEKAYESLSWSTSICVCVFSSYLFILVKDFPTLEINIHICLKQGDLLAPFLFLLVVEGLIDLDR